MDINEILEIGNNIDTTNESYTTTSPTNDLSSNDVDLLDKLVYGGGNGEFVLPEPEKKIYDVNEDLKRMTDITSIPDENFKRCRIPSAIKESIRQNPLNVTPVSDPQLEALANRIGGNGDFSRSLDILKQLEERDGNKNFNKKLNEATNNSVASSGVDYELIKNIVESVVEKKLSQYKQQLTESATRGQNTNSLSVMNIRKDKFLFLDDDNNVYECQMVYKGKNKARKR